MFSLDRLLTALLYEYNFPPPSYIFLNIFIIDYCNYFLKTHYFSKTIIFIPVWPRGNGNLLETLRLALPFYGSIYLSRNLKNLVQKLFSVQQSLVPRYRYAGAQNILIILSICPTIKRVVYNEATYGNKKLYSC